jgi:hypothetical protein
LNVIEKVPTNVGLLSVRIDDAEMIARFEFFDHPAQHFAVLEIHGGDRSVAGLRRRDRPRHRCTQRRRDRKGNRCTARTRSSSWVHVHSIRVERRHSLAGSPETHARSMVNSSYRSRLCVTGNDYGSSRARAVTSTL